MTTATRMSFPERAGARFLLLLALCITIPIATYADTRAEMTARDQTKAPSFSNLLGYVVSGICHQQHMYCINVLLL